MTYRQYIAVNAAIGFLFGVVLLLIPGPALALAGLDVGEGGQLIARLFGVELIGFNFASWLMRNSRDAAGLRMVSSGHMYSEAIGAAVAATAAIAGVGNALIWGVAALYLACSVTFAWFLFLKPSPA